MANTVVSFEILEADTPRVVKALCAQAGLPETAANAKQAPSVCLPSLAGTSSPPPCPMPKASASFSPKVLQNVPTDPASGERSTARPNPQRVTARSPGEHFIVESTNAASVNQINWIVYTE